MSDGWFYNSVNSCACDGDNNMDLKDPVTGTAPAWKNPETGERW